MITAEEWVRLRTSKEPEEYRQAAWEPLSEELCLDIIERFPEMRLWVAQNKTVPLSVLSVLATDPDERVRGMVARKRKIDAELLDLLSRDPSETIRANIARRTKTPIEIVLRLVEDESSWVREAAVEALAKRTGGAD